MDGWMAFQMQQTLRHTVLRNIQIER